MMLRLQKCLAACEEVPDEQKGCTLDIVGFGILYCI